MKRLLLLRHAKSSWDDSTLPDHDRPLAARGRRAAPAMADFMVAHDLLPDLVLSSTSARTTETVEIMSDLLGSPELRFESVLYLAGPTKLLRTVRTAEDDVETLMVVAHNPGIHTFALGLCDRTEGGDLRRLERKFPTAALAVLEFEVSRWRDVDPGRGRLVHFMRPKALPNADRDRL